MSAARIAARLRERLPEADGWRIEVRGVWIAVFPASGSLRGSANARSRVFSAGFDADLRTITDGHRWPERLADAFADALLGAP